MIFEEGKRRKIQRENVAHGKILGQNFKKVAASNVAPLWRHCESIASTGLQAFLLGTDISRYVLKLEKENSCHGYNFCHFLWNYIQ